MMKKVTIFIVLLFVLGGVMACTAAESAPANPSLGDGELSLAAELALGTVRLEETDLAVDERQAAELLPLWQAWQSLRTSDTAASVELEAVAQQIEAAMSAEQVAAIAEMALTAESVTELTESGQLRGGPGGGNGREGADGQEAPPAGFGGGGGRGGQGLGGNPPGGFGGGPGGEINEEALATRQARFAAEGAGGAQEQLLTGAVIRLLSSKTGE